MENEALDFELGKTYQTFFEAGKLKGTAFTTYLLLLGTTSLLVFGEGSKDDVKVPFLELFLNKNSAAAVLLILSCIALYWFNITHIKLWLLRGKLSNLYHERYGKTLDVAWHLEYPTPLWIPTSSTVVTLPPLLAILASSIFSLLTITSYVVPVLLSWRIASYYQFIPIVRCLIGLALITPALIAQLVIQFDSRMSPEKAEGWYQEKFEKWR